MIQGRKLQSNKDFREWGNSIYNNFPNNVLSLNKVLPAVSGGEDRKYINSYFMKLNV